MTRVAVWSRSNGGNIDRAGGGAPGGRRLWQAPVDLSLAGQNAFKPQVAIDTAGDAVSVWSRSNGANTIMQAAARPAASGVWQTPVNLSLAGQNAFKPQVAIDTAGDAVSVWSRSNGANTIMQAAARPAGGSFGGARRPVGRRPERSRVAGGDRPGR